MPARPEAEPLGRASHEGQKEAPPTCVEGASDEMSALFPPVCARTWGLALNVAQDLRALARLLVEGIVHCGDVLVLADGRGNLEDPPRAVAVLQAVEDIVLHLVL